MTDLLRALPRPDFARVLLAAEIALLVAAALLFTGVTR